MCVPHHSTVQYLDVLDVCVLVLGVALNQIDCLLLVIPCNSYALHIITLHFVNA